LVATEFTKRSSSRGDQIRLNKLIEIPFKALPSRAQATPRRNLCWQTGIQRAQAGSQPATVGLGERYGDPTPQAGEWIPLRAGDLDN
jgi:hypothetical protein